MKKTFTILFFLFISQFTKAQELKLFKDFTPGKKDSKPRQLFQTDDYLFFLTDNDYSTNNPTFWKSNGKDSTMALLDISGQGNINPIKAPNNTAFFFYSNYLFFTDGTTNGTKRLRLIENNYSYGENTTIVYNDKLFFSAADSLYNMYLWVSDGTKTGTKPLNFFKKNGNPSSFKFFELNGILYFYSNLDLWKTDGTEAGTIIVNDFSYGYLISILGKYQNYLILVVNYGKEGTELWKTDGTKNGTSMIKDIYIKGNSNPATFTVFMDKMYFTADDGIHGREIWTSDGTEVGTQLLKDIDKSNSNKHITQFHATNNLLYFNAYDSINGYELWKTDGTEAGTNIVKKIIPDTLDKSPFNFVSIGNTLFFVADAGNGNEVYMTDGTETGTHILEPKNRTQSNPIFIFNKTPLFSFKNKLYVVGDYDSAYGEELYVYDPKVNTSSIQTITNQSSYFYPNPAQNEIKIKNNTFTKVDIYDVNGRLVLQSTNTKESIDISSIQAGIYIVKMGNENTQITERLIKY